jgi:hypothetical protein
MIKIDKLEKATQKLRQKPQKLLKSGVKPQISRGSGLNSRFDLAFAGEKLGWCRR